MIEMEVKKLLHFWKVITMCRPLIPDSSNLLGWKGYHLELCQDDRATITFMGIRDLQNVKGAVEMKFWKKEVRASEKSSPISILKIPA